MFSKYFDRLEKSLLKKLGASKKGDRKTKSAKGGGKAKISADLNILKDELNKFILSSLKVDSLKMIDASGYMPDNVDLIAYREIYREMLEIMNGFVPCELVYGTFHISPVLNKEILNDTIRTIVQAKKINRFSERVENPDYIPAFVIAYDTGLKLAELKTLLIDSYMNMSIDNNSEIDIIIILDKGIIIKDWKEKRSCIALETGKDSLMWFYILMNERLDIKKENEFDPRNYVRHTEKYNEY